MKDNDKITLTLNQIKQLVSETSRMQKGKKAFLGHTRNIRNFAIFSPENPMGVSCSSSENRLRREQLERDLCRGHYVYSKVKGKYDNVEHSYFIYNISLDAVKALGAFDRFNQESFFMCISKYDESKRKTGVVFNYYKKDGERKAFRLVETSEMWLDASGEQDYFTAIGRNFKFTIAMNEFGNIPKVDEMYERKRKAFSENGRTFDEYLDESISTGFNAWTRRAKIAKKTDGEN